DIEDLTIDLTECQTTLQRGLHVSEAAEANIGRLEIINAQSHGVHVAHCFDPNISGMRIWRSNFNSLGYGMLVSECRDGKITHFRSHNCRRMVDCGMACQSWNLHVTDFGVDGGWKTDTGVIWESDDEFNYGIGDHGQSAGWVWDDGFVRNVKVGILERGTGAT